MAALLQVVGAGSSCICSTATRMAPSTSAAIAVTATSRRQTSPSGFSNNRTAASSSHCYELMIGISERRCPQEAVLNGDIEKQSCGSKAVDVKTEGQPTKREKKKSDMANEGGRNGGENGGGDDDEEDLRDAKSQQQQRQAGEKASDYYANVGDAIRTLRKELPNMFQEDLSYGIYRDDVVLTFWQYSRHGVDNYKQVMKYLRAMSRIFFKKTWVEVHRIWQRIQTDDVILVRWSVHGYPRLPWNAKAQFDGMSEYKVDSNGLIYEHKIDNIIPWSSQSYQMASWARNTVPIGIGTPLCTENLKRSFNASLREHQPDLLDMVSYPSMQIFLASPLSNTLVMTSATHLFGLEIREAIGRLEDLRQNSTVEFGEDCRVHWCACIDGSIWPDQNCDSGQVGLVTMIPSEKAKRLAFWYVSRLLSPSKLDLSKENMKLPLIAIPMTDL